jgi:PPOX class probable F420-dependent enzyme
VDADPALLELIATHHEGVLATVKPSGHPQLTNIYYHWDAEEKVVRISTTVNRLKARNIATHPQAALHVSGSHFYSWAVAEGDAELSPVSESPGDATARELRPVYETFNAIGDEDDFHARLIAEKRLVIRLRVTRVYGVALEKPPR